MYLTSRYLPPTDRLTARYKAGMYDEGLKCCTTVECDCALSPADNASAAVKKLIRRNGLNIDGIWDSFFLCDRHPKSPAAVFTAIPDGPGADRKTYSMED